MNGRYNVDDVVTNTYLPVPTNNISVSLIGNTTNIYYSDIRNDIIKVEITDKKTTFMRIGVDSLNPKYPF